MAKVEVKQPIVDKIAEEIKDAQSVVLVDYRGLTVAQDTELRKQLREAGVIYKVYKNTMMKLQPLMTAWKDQALSLFLKMTQQHRQESFTNLHRMLRHLNLRVV